MKDLLLLFLGVAIVGILYLQPWRMLASEPKVYSPVTQVVRVDGQRENKKGGKLFFSSLAACYNMQSELDAIAAMTSGVAKVELVECIEVELPAGEEVSDF